MADVADILKEKGSAVIQVEVGSNTLDAARTMIDAGIGAILVTDGGTIVGIVSERDVLRHVATDVRPLERTLVDDVMVSPVVCVEPTTSVAECMALVTERRIRHLPVVDAGALVGLVSIGDLVKLESREQRVRISYLTEYISAR